MIPMPQGSAIQDTIKEAITAQNTTTTIIITITTDTAIIITDTNKQVFLYG